MIVTMTYGRLFDAALAAQRWLNAAGSDGKRDETKATGRKNTKLGYALTRMEPRIKKVAEAFNLLIEEVNIDHAATDEKKILVLDERGGFRYTPERLKERNAAQRALNLRECEIDCYFATEVPDDLTEEETEALTGFVIKEEAASATE